jgi:chemotaxis protein CheD
MIHKKHHRSGIPIYLISPGEYHATGESCLLNTVVGSCVVVCLYDRYLRIGGMGHFIVPGMIGTEGIISSEIAERGIVSIEYIMALIVKLGGDRKRLAAKLFGAGYQNYVNPDIIRSNISFLHEYFTIEKIAVEKEDLGGNVRREIMFNPNTGKVFRRILVNNEKNSEFIEMEKEYIEKAFNSRDIKTNYILFE